jgi:hypothetical protein
MFRFCRPRQRRRGYGGWRDSQVKASLSDDTPLFRLGQGYLCFRAGLTG